MNEKSHPFAVATNENLCQRERLKESSKSIVTSVKKMLRVPMTGSLKSVLKWEREKKKKNRIE